MRLLLIISALVGSLTLFSSCGSKEKKEEAATSATDAPPALETAPMSFDAAGSDSGKIPGLQTVHFEYDSSKLNAEGKGRLKANSEWLKNNPKANLQVEGHCDSRGTNEYNLALGERRAKAVRDYLTSLGVSGNRLSIISMGEEKPVATGETEAAYAKNRRANFVPIVPAK